MAAGRDNGMATGANEGGVRMTVNVHAGADNENSEQIVVTRTIEERRIVEDKKYFRHTTTH